MSFFQFAAAIGGFAKANGADSGGMTPEEEAELSAWLDEPPIWEKQGS